MRHLFACVVLGLVAPFLQAQEDGISGSWKYSLLQEEQQTTFWFLKIQTKDGSIEGEGEALLPRLPDVKVSGKIEGEVVKINLTLPNSLVFEFEGKLPKVGAKKIFGSTTVRGEMMPSVMEATNAKTKGDLTKEIVVKTPSDPRVFGAVLKLISEAKANKASAEEVGEWVEAVLRSAENYGPRWQFDYTLKLIEALARQKDYAALAVNAARKAEGMIDGKTSPEVQLRILSALGNALAASGKADDAKAVLGKVDALENKAYEEYDRSALNFEPQKFDGKRTTQRAVLVELFTGAQCPPCVAADMGFDGLEKTYSPKDVVLLQYHLHIPRPDALGNPASEARQGYYEKFIEGTPTILFNGKPVDGGGGPKAAAPKMYLAFRQIVEKMLEDDTKIRIAASAVRTGDKIAIDAKVSGIEKPGDKIRLRLVLVEDWVRYKGSNGLTYHHRVVRAMPGGPNGQPLTKAEGEKSVTVDLSELREELNRYLDESGPYPDAQRPMRLKNLHVVALVQDDASLEVLQAVEVPVRSE
jgi:hypothetical protein